MTPAPISRRRAIVLGGLDAASLAIGATGWVATSAGVRTGGRLGLADTGAELRQSQALDSADGRLQVELTAAAGGRPAAHATRARGYNLTSPGPTLRVRPGYELAVGLTDRLDEPPTCTPRAAGLPAGQPRQPVPACRPRHLVRLPLPDPT